MDYPTGAHLLQLFAALAALEARAMPDVALGFRLLHLEHWLLAGATVLLRLSGDALGIEICQMRAFLNCRFVLRI